MHGAVLRKNKMKTILVIIVIVISNVASAQYPSYGPNVGMNNVGLGLQGILSNNFASSPQQGAMYGEAAMINAYGNYAVNQSMANINNQMAYGMALDNKLKRIRTTFEARQINRYYRDIEAWQAAERNRLKNMGIYDREAIEDVYNIRRP